MYRVRSVLEILTDNVLGSGDYTALKGVVAIAGGMIAAALGGADPLLRALVFAVVLDYLAGLGKAVIRKEVSSLIGAKGIARKILYFLMVALACLVEEVAGSNFRIREIVILFYLSNEGISILENVIDAGVPVPEKLKDILIQLRKKADPEEDDDRH